MTEPTATMPEHRTAMEVVPEGTCPLCKKHRTSQEIIAIEVSCYGYFARRFGCIDCKDRVNVAVMNALASIHF